MRHKAQVRDWMTVEPITAREETTLIEAYKLMRSRGVRRLPVVDTDHRLAGIVTRSDIEQVMPLAPHGGERAEALYSLAGMTVAEVMARSPVSVQADQAIQDAAELMLRAKVSGLPVVTADKVVGIITESDIFKLVVESWTDQDETSG